MKLIKKDFDKLNIPFYVLNSTPENLAKLVDDNQIGGVVCDFYPLKYPKKLVDIFIKHVSKDVCVLQVGSF